MTLWGLKTEAAFDVWSIEHIAMGVSVGWIAKIIVETMTGRENISHQLFMKISFLTALLLAYVWECVEHYLETGLAGSTVADWLQGVEHWSNRLIFDNLMVVLGWYIYNNKHKVLNFARIFSCFWLFIHIFIFPHSMYLHQCFSEFGLFNEAAAQNVYTAD